MDDRPIAESTVEVQLRSWAAVFMGIFVVNVNDVKIRKVNDRSLYTLVRRCHFILVSLRPSQLLVVFSQGFGSSQRVAEEKGEDEVLSSE